MRAVPRLSSSPLHSPSRRTTLLLVVVLSVAGAMSTWQGSLLAAGVPLAGAAFGGIVFVLVRRSLRNASTLIDTILCEELHHHEQADPALHRGSRHP